MLFLPQPCTKEEGKKGYSRLLVAYVICILLIEVCYYILFSFNPMPKVYPFTREETRYILLQEMLTNFTKFTHLVGKHCDLNPNLPTWNSSCYFTYKTNSSKALHKAFCILITYLRWWPSYTFLIKVFFSSLIFSFSLNLLLNSFAELFISLYLQFGSVWLNFIDSSSLV